MMSPSGAPGLTGIEANPAHFGGPQLPVFRTGADSSEGQGITAGKTPAKRPISKDEAEYISNQPGQEDYLKGQLAREQGVDTSMTEGQHVVRVAPGASPPAEYAPEPPGFLQTVGDAASRLVRHVTGGSDSTTLTPQDQARLHAKDSTLY